MNKTLMVTALLAALLAGVAPTGSAAASPCSAYVDEFAYGPFGGDGSNWDASNWDASNWDASNWDASNWDASNWDASNWDGSNWDGSNWDGSNWDGSNWDGSNWDRSNVDVQNLAVSFEYLMVGGGCDGPAPCDAFCGLVHA